MLVLIAPHLGFTVRSLTWWMSIQAVRVTWRLTSYCACTFFCVQEIAYLSNCWPASSVIVTEDAFRRLGDMRGGHSVLEVYVYDSSLLCTDTTGRGVGVVSGGRLVVYGV